MFASEEFGVSGLYVGTVVSSTKLGPGWLIELGSWIT
jgi:hypothetical protein